MNKKKKFLLLFAPQKSVLPAGYTALEYLETSGTQFIDTGLRGCDLSSLVEFSGESNINARRAFQGQGFAFMSVNGADLTHYAQMPVGMNRRRIGYLQGVPYVRDYAVRISGGEIEVNGEVYTAADFRPSDTSESDNDATGYALALFSFPDPTQQTGSRWNGTCRRFRAKLLSGSVDFVPALRNSDNVAGMWDTVSKQFFTNAGTGVFGYRVKGAPAAFSLRDPYRVAPSGVYARKVSETELEIIADTEETSGDGWGWFANSADAMEHFGITESEQI